MIRTGGIAGRGSNATVLLPDELGVAEPLIARVTPELAPYLAMHPFRESFRQPIGKRFEHDCAVVILARFEFRELSLDAETGRHGERAGVVRQAGRFRRHEIREAVVRLAGGALVLLTQIAPRH